MKYLSVAVASFFIGILAALLMTKTNLGGFPNLVIDVVKQRCFSAEQFSNGGMCLPEQPFVAVVRNGDGSKDLIWGEENINKLLSSPTPQQEK